MKKGKLLKNKVVCWLLDRRSNEETAGKGTWIFVTLMIILIVAGILVAGSKTGFSNIINTFVSTTTGSNTPVGDWNK
jgi:hypothetical protein